eukprot:6467795-Amphidinium_carterae.3
MEHWTSRLRLHSILLGDFDGRTVNGLRKCADRLAGKREKAHEAGQLKRFLKQCVAAQALAPDQLGKVAKSEKMGDEELTGHLNALLPDVSEWPQGLRETLLQRQVSKFLDSKNIDALFPIINPLGDPSFDPLKPTLSGLARTTAGKISAFQRIIFNNVLLGMIYDGEPASQAVVNLSASCLKVFEEADLVAMDGRAAVLHDECCTIWRALLAVGRDTLDVSTEDFGHNNRSVAKSIESGKYESESADVTVGLLVLLCQMFQVDLCSNCMRKTLGTYNLRRNPQASLFW